MCVLAATALALAAVELDGMHPPAAVALVGGGLGLALLVAAAVADRRWWHLGGALIGTAVAVIIVAVWARVRPAARAPPPATVGVRVASPAGAVRSGPCCPPAP